MLELQRAFYLINFADNYDEWSRKAFDGEVSCEFFGIPDLSIRRFQRLP